MGLTSGEAMSKAPDHTTFDAAHLSVALRACQIHIWRSGGALQRAQDKASLCQRQRFSCYFSVAY